LYSGEMRGLLARRRRTDGYDNERHVLVWVKRAAHADHERLMARALRFQLAGH
jgi:hypothetical protein